MSAWSNLGLAFSAASVIAGCQVLSEREGHHHRRDVAEVVRPATVDVGGDVVNPGRLEMTEQGMSLRRALALSGGIRQGVTAVPGDALKFDPSTVKQLKELWSRIGKMTAFADYTNQAVAKGEPLPIDPAVIAQNQKDLDEAKKTAGELLAKQKDSTWFTDLDILRRLVERYENKEEILRLLEKYPTQKNLIGGQTKEQIEKSRDEAKEQIEDLEKRVATTRDQAVVALKNDTRGYLVALQRGSPPDSYYFPFEAASSGVAGEIPLQPDDLVQILHYSETTLGRSQQLAIGENLSVQGFVHSPGIHRIDVGLSHVQDLSNKFPEFKASNAVWTLARANASGGADVFVLPPDLASGTMSDVRLLGNDALTLTTLPLVPVVTEGLLQRSLGGNRELARTDANLKRAERQAKRAQKWDESMANAGPITSNLMRGLQESCQTLRNRLGLGVR
jgi:hypothetical protein